MLCSLPVPREADTAALSDPCARCAMNSYEDFPVCRVLVGAALPAEAACVHNCSVLSVWRAALSY